MDWPRRDPVDLSCTCRSLPRPPPRETRRHCALGGCAEGPPGVLRLARREGMGTLDERFRARYVELFIDGEKVASIEPSGPSPEQALSFPRLPLAAACCFSHQIPRDRLPERETSVLEVVARPRAGDTEWTALQRVARRIHRSASLTPPPHTRQDYGAVWDAASFDAGSRPHGGCGLCQPGRVPRSGSRTTADDVARGLQVGATDVVLGIGCGTGRIGLHLASRCRQWIGSDVSASMLDHARATLAGHANVSFIQLNGFDLAGVDDASVDVVYCSAVFMHLEECGPLSLHDREPARAAAGRASLVRQHEPALEGGVGHVRRAEPDSTRPAGRRTSARRRRRRSSKPTRSTPGSPTSACGRAGSSCRSSGGRGRDPPVPARD